METKKIIIISCLILLAVATSLFIVTKYNKSILEIGNQENILDVDNVVVDPSAYSGKIVLKGAVSFVYPEEKSFSVIDVKEFASCGVVTCAINHLTVSYSKQLPKVKDIVEITGELIKDDGKYILNAKDVKVEWIFINLS